MPMRRDVLERRKIAFVKRKTIDAARMPLPEMMPRDRRGCAVRMRSVLAESRKKMRDELDLMMRSVNAVRNLSKMKWIVSTDSIRMKKSVDAASKKKK